MAALTGDLYQMLNDDESKTQAQKQTSTALSSISSEPSTISKTSLNTTQEDDEEKKGEAVYSPTENTENGPAGTTADSATNTVTDSTTPAVDTSSLEDVFNRTLALQKIWMGDDYEWSDKDAQTFTNLLKVSDNPEDTAARYITAKGISDKVGLDTQLVYDNLDEISQYYTGDVYDPKGITLAQKWKNGWTRNDIMSLEYEYMLAHSTGDDEKASALEEQIEAKKAELDSNTSSIPLSWWDNLTTSVLENFAYMVQPAVEGTAASKVVDAIGTYAASVSGMYAPAVLAGTKVLSTTASMIFSGKRMYEWAAGEAYYNYMHDEQYNGVQNRGQARVQATVQGLGTALIEMCLDGASAKVLGAVSGKTIRTIGINTVAEVSRKGFSSAATDAVWQWVTGFLDEGFFNELPEYWLDELGSIIYKNSNGIIDDKTWSDRKDEMIESIKDGIIVGAVYGGLSIPATVRNDRATAINLRRAANQSRTESEFREATKDMKPETMTDEDFDTARTQVYKASQEQKSEFLYDNFKDTVLESEEIAGQELYNTVDENGEETAKVIPDGTVYRDTEGELYSESKTDDNTGTTKVYYGDRTSGAVYGYVEVATDGDTQTVRSVRVRHGYESIRSEMVRNAVANTATTETNVEWNPTTHGLQSVKDELISNNPDKKGLVYRTTLTGRDADIQSVKTQIKTANPNISDAEATVAARLTTIADVGTGTIKYESSANIPEGQRTRETTDFRGATDTAKALIYTGEQSDISTYVHELFHAVASVRTKEAQNLSNSIRKTFADEAETANLRKFVTDHVEIWGKDGDVEKIMSSLKAIGENATAKEWTVGQNENLARLYEAYRSSSKSVQQSLPQAIRAILEKLTQFMNKVYRTMKDNTALNEDIAKAYDSLMGMNEAAQRVESKGAEAEFRAHGDVAIDEDGNDVGDAGLIYQEVTDKGLLEELEEGETIKVYRSMQLIDGKLYPPMAEVVEGKRQAATEVGKWYQSDERPDLAFEKKKEKGSGKWYFKLLKYYVNGESSTVDARYNPYFHTTSSPLNDQFSAAYRRPNLVVVEVEMPKSELTSGYRAEKAKDTVGEMNWHSGKVSGALAKKTGKHRSVILTRYNKVIRILDNAEVASNIAEQLKDTGIKIPENVVSPGLYEELKKLGVEFVDVKDVQKYRDAQNGILYQDTTLDDLDSINNLDDAERIANEGVTDAEAANEADYFRTHNVESEIFDLDLPEDYEYNFTSDDANRLESERQLESALPTIDSIELPPDVAGVFWEEYDESELAGRDPEDGLIQGSNNLGWTYPQFVGINEPKGIEYTGTDAQKDTIFREAIKDDTVLKQYLSLIAEASLYGTRYTNRGYEDGTDSFGRFTQVAVDYPFKDDAYRQTLRDRLYPQLSGRSLTGIMQTVLTNSDDLTEAQIKKARKELSDNARAYRNMLALLTKNDEMLPVELVSEVEGLDIPSRETQNSMSISDIAALARKAGNKTLENSILNGTAKFGKGADVTALKDLKALITDLNKQIKDKEAEVEKLDTESKTYETELSNANEAIESYRKAILDAEEVLSVLADTFDGENEDGTASSSAKYRGELAQKYAALQEKYSILSPYREQEHQADATEAQLDRKVKDGSHMREKKTKGHAGWRQQYRGQKYETEAWVKEVTSTYPDIKERIEAEVEKDKRKSYEAVAKEVIETVRGELKDELDSLRVQMTASAARTVQANFSKLYKSLSAIKAISEGTGTVVANVDLDEMKATQRELSVQLIKAQEKVEKRETTIDELKSVLKEEQKKSKDTKKEYQKDIDEFEKKLSKATAELEKAQKEISDIETEAKEAKTEAKEKLGKQKEKTAEIKEARKAEREELRHRVKEKNEEIRWIKAEYKKALYDAVTLERWKQAKEKLEQKKLEKRDAAYNARQRQKEIDDAVTWERWKNAKREHEKALEREQQKANEKYVHEREIAELKEQYQREIDDTILLERWKAARNENELRKRYDERTDKAVLLERWKAAKREREAEIEQSRKDADTKYLHEKEISDLKDKYEDKLDEAVTWERWKAAKAKHEAQIKQMQKDIDNAYIVKQKLAEQKAEYEKEVKEIKEEQRQKEKQKRIYQTIRDEKQRIANRIMRNVNLKTVDYSKAREITAIQALIDPEFRRDWVYDLQTDAAQESGYQTMTIEEAKDYLNSLDDAQRIDLFSYMPQDLIERLTEQRRPLNDWTIAELQTLSNAVEELRLEGEAILKAKKDARNAQAMSIQRDILRTLGPLEEHDTIPSSIDRSKEKKSIRERWHGIVYRTRRMQELAQLLDGGFGHKGTGYRLLVEEKRWHQNREQQKIEGRYKAVESYATKEAIDGMVDSVEVQLAGINKPVTFTVDQLAYAWLSQYDELNKAAVMYGCLLTESEKGTKYPAGYDVDYLTGKKIITNNWLVNRGELISDDLELEAIAKDRYDTLLNKAKEELTDRGLWDLVNAIKDDFNNRDNSDRLDAASIEYFNVPLAKRESYLPIRRQALTGQNLEDAKADEVFNKYTGQFQRDPYKGFLQERITISPRHQMPVDMSLLGVWQQSVKDQEHFIEFCGYIKKLRSIFTSNRSNEVQRAITAKRTTALFDEIDRYINLVANPDAEQGKQDTINNVIRTVRGKTGAAYLGWKASGIILQAITSPASAFSELKPWEVIGSYLQIARHPIESIKAINEKSTFMKNRTMNPIIDEAIQRRNEWTKSSLSKKVDKFEEVGQIGLTLVDRYAVAGPWLAKYQRTLSESLKNGMDTATAEQFAVTKADEFILQTQPVGDSTEIASMFRSKSEVAKTLLQFQTSLNVVWNNLTANTIGYARNNKMASAVGMIIGYSVAGILLGLVQNGFDDDDDSGDKAKKLAYWSVSQLLGSTPIFGSTADSFVKDLITGDYDWYMLNGVSISPIVNKTIQGVTALKSDKPMKAIGKFAEAGGLAVGLPTSGFKEVVEVFQKHSLAPLVGRE